MPQLYGAGGTEFTGAGRSPVTTPPSGTARRRDRIRGLRRILVFDVAGPLIAYNLLRSHGTSQVLALILSGILPAIGVLIDLIHDRSLDVVGCVVLGGLLLGAVLGLLTHDPRVVLLEGSVVTAAFALSALGSLVIGRPLMFHFAQAATGGEHSPAGRDFKHRYDTTPEVRRFFRIVTVVWGVAFTLEAAVKVVVIDDLLHRVRPHLHPNRALPPRRCPSCLDNGPGPRDPAVGNEGRGRDYLEHEIRASMRTGEAASAEDPLAILRRRVGPRRFFWLDPLT